ncbi:hypothetical protein Y1Q_0006365 [Alligator mississippiensis]|uniref:Uncharacterized protein n=1 Tax=Alligator mississippiensis TaxID=8496 RepID=A0A151NXL3_ALLMI|nr:hypothetical protein Y1Q_0006365 [Alligator mississippiensis]
MISQASARRAQGRAELSVSAQHLGSLVHCSAGGAGQKQPCTVWEDGLDAGRTQLQNLFFLGKDDSSRAGAVTQKVKRASGGTGPCTGPTSCFSSSWNSLQHPKFFTIQVLVTISLATTSSIVRPAACRPCWIGLKRNDEPANGCHQRKREWSSGMK